MYNTLFRIKYVKKTDLIKKIKRNKKNINLDNIVYVRMNTMMMKKFNTIEAKDLELINLENLNELSKFIDR